MNFEAIKDFVTSKTARQILITQKHSPKILFVAGTVGVVGAAVLACRATLKTSNAIDQFDEDKLRLVARYPDSEEAFDKDYRSLQIKTAISIVKPYLPAIGLGIVSIGALTGSHVILTKRNGAVMAAYAAVDRAFKEYRGRVSDEYGKDVDQKLFSGAYDALTDEKMADGTTKTKSVTYQDGKFGGSPYAVVFDEISKHFSKEPGRNPDFLSNTQSWANDKLKAKGHIFLNEVRDMLGLPRVPEGQAVGWIYNSKDADHKGDGYVSFGLFDNDPDWYERFLDGKEWSIVLDFNVDGVIYDKI